MDGNGRWAESQGLARVEGHQAGIKTVKRVIQHCVAKKIPVLSLFAFSSENWTRPEDEVNFLMQLFVDALAREIQALHEQGVRIKFSGDRSQLSSVLCQQMQQAEHLTTHNMGLLLNIAVNYSGKWDIVQAARRIAAQVEQGHLSSEAINESLFASHLDTAGLPDPDLLIRTSGEERISNFFLWQLAYTELYFTEIHWPDFTAQALDKALEEFNIRERRFGKTTKQIKENDYV